LKATNTDVAIGKYPINQTPIFKEKTFQLLWRYWKWPKNHNTTKSSHGLSLRLRILLATCRHI